MKLLQPILLILSIANIAVAQSIDTSSPKAVDKKQRYMFYLHGRILEEQGLNATHPQFGRYEYQPILDSLKKGGFDVISEVRPKNTDEKVYADKITRQVDSLIRTGVSPTKIFVFGASKGAYIALWVSAKARNEQLNFIVMGTCSEETTSDFKAYDLCGRFLSIYEKSDTFATACSRMLSTHKCVKRFDEIKLTMNNGHGFLFKPYGEWMVPLVKWASK